MNKLKRIGKQVLKKILPSKVIKLLAKLKNRLVESEFPTDSYRYKKIDARKVSKVIISGKLHHKIGNQATLLEKEFAKYHKSKYAIATNSGTSALEMAIKSIGIKPGDEVIVPDYTFVATAQAVVDRGGVPVFADIDDTYTIAPGSIREKITKKTRAIVPVHMFGNVADLGEINKIAKDYHLYVIEDACQAIGASYRGKKVGSVGDIGCFSFDINKAITTGQGGMLITSNRKFYETTYVTREAGQLKDDEGSDVVTTGNNYAMTEMQAILARSALTELDSLNMIRRELYEYFVNGFCADYLPLRWNRKLPNTTPSLLRLVFMIDFEKLKIDRRQFLSYMNNIGIPFKTFYPKPIHSYSLFKNRIDKLTKNSYPFNLNKDIDYNKMQLPFTEKFCNQQVGINFSPYIQKKHIDKLCYSLRNYLLSNIKSNLK